MSHGTERGGINMLAYLKWVNLKLENSDNFRDHVASAHYVSI